MSYSFDMSFTELKEKNILDYCIKLMKFDLENAKEIINNNRFYIPSIRGGYYEKDGCKYAKTPWLEADRNWLYKLFTERFVYWPEKGLLGIVGTINKRFDSNVISINFQDGTDQDYPYECWKGISYFEKIIYKYKNMDKEKLRPLFEEWDDLDEELENNPEYFRQSAIYKEIYNELELNSWLYCNPGKFKIFSMCACNYFEEAFNLFIKLEMVRREIIKELEG